ncbi:hypothetical protein BSAF29S_04117 [Bacillus safensis subsp. safensis]
MILYTPMPYEAIYAEEQGERKLQQVNIQGVPVMVEMQEDEAEIVQVVTPIQWIFSIKSLHQASD